MGDCTDYGARPERPSDHCSRCGSYVHKPRVSGLCTTCIEKEVQKTRAYWRMVDEAKEQTAVYPCCTAPRSGEHSVNCPNRTEPAGTTFPTGNTWYPQEAYEQALSERDGSRLRAERAEAERDAARKEWREACAAVEVYRGRLAASEEQAAAFIADNARRVKERDAHGEEIARLTGEGFDARQQIAALQQCSQEDQRNRGAAYDDGRRDGYREGYEDRYYDARRADPPPPLDWRKSAVVLAGVLLYAAGWIGAVLWMRG